MTDATVPYQAQQVSSKKKSPVLIIIIIVAVVIAGVMVLRRPKQTEKTIITPSELESLPSPTEEPDVSKDTVKIQVVNGTGTPGQAGDVVTLLEDAGYSSGNIETDNAEEFETTTTTIAEKEGYSKIASDIKDALKSDFDKINVTYSLDKDGEYDIVITTGGEKYEEEQETTEEQEEVETTPTETPTETPTPTP